MVKENKPLWQILEPGPKDRFPDIIYVIVEVPKGTKAKYEMDKKTGILFLNRDLFTSMVYPGDYGSIPQTFCEDGDPVDALVLVSQKHHPGIIIPARPVALIKMEDEQGRDDKILCVPDTKVDPTFKDIKGLKDISEHYLSEIKHFFKHMKELEPGKWLKFEKWEGVKVAKKYILDSTKLYKEKFGK